MATPRSAFSTSLFVEGLRKVFFDQYKALATIYPQIYEVVPSSKRQETFHTIPGLGMLTAKGEGESMDFEDMVDGFEKSLQHTAYAKGIRLTREFMDDALYAEMKKQTQALAKSARYRKEYDHALLFNNATATTYFTGGDALALLSNSHTIAGNPAVTFDNYDASTDLSLTALESAFNAMRRFPDDTTAASAMYINLEPATLLIPPELEWTAIQLLQSTGIPGLMDNDVNPMKSRLKIVIWPMITDTNAWFVLANKSDVAPVSFNRVDLEFDHDKDFSTKDILVSAYTRYSNGFVDPRFCYGSMGSS
jgi:phage major head subunit gpT-like protein